MIELAGTHDRCQGPVQRFEIRDAGAARDFATAACEVYVHEEDGTLIAKRPGVVVSPKSSGYVDIMLSGRETDWDGLGRNLILKPRLYYATAPDGTVGVNVLTNPSFDTDANLDGIADGWTSSGAWTKSIVSDDTMPATIFGSAQGGVFSGILGSLFQSYAATIVAGDRWSSGVWYRGVLSSGTPYSTIYGFGSGVGTPASIPSGVSPWTFLRSTRLWTGPDTDAAFYAFSTGASPVAACTFRLDEAFLFKGFWRIVHAEPLRYPARPGSRIAKTGGNLIPWGGFEADSDTDGLCDLWAKAGTAVAYTREVDPDQVYAGTSSQKCVLADPTNNRIWAIRRGHFKTGETWSAKVRVLTSGTLSAGAGTGGFQITLRTEDYDGAAQAASTTLTNPAAAWTDHTCSLTLTEDRDALVVEIWLNGKTGTLWIDDVRLTKV